MLRSGLLFPLLLLAAVSAHAERACLLGKEAPPLEIVSWLAAPEGETLAALRGRVVILLLPGAVDMEDAKAVARWNDLRAGWWEKGLRVIALLEGEPGTLPEDLEFSVAVGKAPAYGDGADPHAVLIAADGKVGWEGLPKDLGDELIAKRVSKAKTFWLGLSGAAAKTPAAAAYKKGKLAEARALAAAQSPQGEDAVHVSGRVGAMLAYWQRQAKRATKVGSYDEAATCLKRIVKHFGDAQEATAAADEMTSLKANREVSKECSAADAYARLRQGLAKTKGKTKKIAALVKKAERVAKKTPATRSVERAARLAAALRADPAISALQSFIAKTKIRTAGARWRNDVPRPPEVEFPKDKTYYWTFETNKGSMTLRFFPDVAPMHVSSAMYLTLLGFFDGLTFHRVIPGFMAQGGCPDGSGSGKPGYAFDGEFDDKAVHDREGILSAAHSGPGTDGSQFFITFGPAKHLDMKHTVYGVLVKGEDTLKKLEKCGTADGPPKEKLLIEKATVFAE